MPNAFEEIDLQEKTDEEKRKIIEKVQTSLIVLIKDFHSCGCRSFYQAGHIRTFGDDKETYLFRLINLRSSGSEKRYYHDLTGLLIS